MAPKTAPKRNQKRCKNEAKNQESKKPIQDDLGPVLGRSWTVLAPPRGRSTAICAPLGSHLGRRIGTKTEPKTIQKRSEKSRGKKTDPRRSWTRLGAILGRLGCHLGPAWPSKSCSRPGWRSFFLKNHFFDVKTVRKRSWDQLWPIKVSKRPKMTPKTEPKSTPRRSKNDIKIDIKNDAKTKRAGQETGRGVWVGTSRDLPGGAPGTQGRRPRPHGTSKRS